MFDLNLSQLTIPLPENTDVVDYTIRVNNVEISQEVEVLSIEIEHCFNRIASAR